MIHLPNLSKKTSLQGKNSYQGRSSRPPSLKTWLLPKNSKEVISGRRSKRLIGNQRCMNITINKSGRLMISWREISRSYKSILKVWRRTIVILMDASKSTQTLDFKQPKRSSNLWTNEMIISTTILNSKCSK